MHEGIDLNPFLNLADVGAHCLRFCGLLLINASVFSYNA
jgi:hypothetical protein